jgi:arylsulfatase
MKTGRTETNRSLLVFPALLAVALICSIPARAQQPAGVPQSDRWTHSSSAQHVTGVPGSPSATVTIGGEQIPAPPQKFEGKIQRTTAGSKPYWPPRVEPPKGAPNVLLIMTDDSGYGVPSTFGGVIPTPALDRIANNGLRFTNFNSTALSS